MSMLNKVDAPTRTIRAPRGNQRVCKSWAAEAAMRMLMNNLDPEVAERPQDLVVYGGRGQAARNWECYDAIIASLKSLDVDETLLVQRQACWNCSHASERAACVDCKFKLGAALGHARTF